MDRRRALIGIVTVTSLAAIGSNGALGQPRTVRIGLLAGRPDSNYVPGILYKLSELGYRGSTVVVLQRSSDGAVERYPALARELVESKCDVIFAIGDQAAARAARDSALNVPVVFLAVDYDPVQKGIVRNLTRPGGSVTGVYVPQGDLVAKRLEILHELVPQAKRFLVLSDIFSIDQLPALKTAAMNIGVELIVIQFAKPPYDFRSAFGAGLKANAGGVVVLGSPNLGGRSSPIGALLLEYRMPGIAQSPSLAASGAVITLSANVPKLTARAAEIGVRILKGTKPGDIPVEQADEFDLVINLKTANTLDMKIPARVMARATRLIE